MHVKEGGASEHTHRLRNRHGPTVAQRCLALSIIELPKQTLILFEIMSYQFVLRFRLKYIGGAFIMCAMTKHSMLTQQGLVLLRMLYINKATPNYLSSHRKYLTNAYIVTVSLVAPPHCPPRPLLLLRKRHAAGGTQFIHTCSITKQQCKN